MLLYLFLYVGTRDLNSGPHPGTVGTFPNESPPALLSGVCAYQ